MKASIVIVLVVVLIAGIVIAQDEVDAGPCHAEVYYLSGTRRVKYYRAHCDEGFCCTKPPSVSILLAECLPYSDIPPIPLIPAPTRDQYGFCTLA